MGGRIKIALLLAPALLVIGLLFSGGIVAALVQSLGYMPAVGQTEISFAAYKEVLRDKDFLNSLALTLYVAGPSTGISTVLAVLTALALRSSSGRISAVVFQLPITIPHLVAAVGIALVVSQTGLGARLAAALGLIGEPKQFPALLYDRYSIGIILTYVWKEMPFIALVVLASGASKEDSGGRVKEALRQVQMEGFADRRPGELSGSQQQRVALARALVTKPRLLLLDEPLSALDANLRSEIRELIKSLQRDGGYTTVFVTHDQEEAVVLADRIALLFDGELQMYDHPQVFYDRPANREVARFFGAGNFLTGHAEDGTVHTPLGDLRLANPGPRGDVTLTIRPEAIRLEDGENSFSARITSVTYLGTQVDYTLEATGTELHTSLPPHVRLKVGDEVTARLPAESLWTLRS